MATKKKTKKKAARAVVPCGPKPRQFLVVLEVTVKPGDDDPGLWDWETLVGDPVLIQGSYLLKTRED